jgi:hypothetical protein
VNLVPRGDSLLERSPSRPRLDPCRPVATIIAVAEDESAAVLAQQMMENEIAAVGST